MSATRIEWADVVWNPVTGCTSVSVGCANCYARRMAQRLRGRFGYPEDDPFRPGTVHDGRLTEPFGWRKPQRIFVCSMGDLFHEDVPTQKILAVLSVVFACAYSSTSQHLRAHRFFILTKRPERMHRVLTSWWPWQDEPMPNTWLGVSVENQAAGNERIPILLQIPAAKRFVSIEPMLGPVDLGRWIWGDRCPDPQCGDSTWDHYCRLGEQRLHWVIVGGETGPGARPMHPDWVRSVRDQCIAAGVPFFFKGWGEYSPDRPDSDHTAVVAPDGWWAIGSPSGCGRDHPGVKTVWRVGKRRSGDLLDGKRWEQVPD